jgi:hypothetical protein
MSVDLTDEIADINELLMLSICCCHSAEDRPKPLPVMH